uniref:Uncharacterized protein n=1 Tax=Oryza glumipatula TaxID=40148 RepID=A0A0E0A408_9ORYZ
MEAMEGRIVELIQSLAAKVEGVSTMSARLDTIDNKLAQHGNQLEKMQVKVDLSMTSFGQVQMDQVVMAKAMKATANQASPLASPTSEPPLLDTPPRASTSKAPTPPPKLVYYLRLYDPTLSVSFLLSQFIKGLKEELCFSVLAQLPEDVNQAYRVALAF